MTQPVPFPPILELDPAASTMLDLLVELGHLDEKMLTQVNRVLGSLDKPLDADGVGTIDVRDVRRVAALALFERLPDLDGETRRMIQREWRLLFY